MATPRSRDFGRRVRNFDHGEWERRREDIMLTCAYAKFAQNPLLRQHILSTGNRVLAEASPVDRLWGIGLDATHPDAGFPSRWTGRNLLGKTLMEVRRLLQDTPVDTTAHASPPPRLLRLPHLLCRASTRSHRRVLLRRLLPPLTSSAHRCTPLATTLPRFYTSPRPPRVRFLLRCWNMARIWSEARSWWTAARTPPT